MKMDQIVRGRVRGSWWQTATAAVLAAAAILGCGDTATPPGSGPDPEPVTEAGLLRASDLPTDEPFDDWEAAPPQEAEDPDSESNESESEDPDLPACSDLTKIDPELSTGLEQMARSAELTTASRDTVTVMGLLARNTVYEYQTPEAAQAAFDRIDESLYAECVGRDVTPGEEGSVAGIVEGGGNPSVDAEDSVVYRVAMSDYTYFGGNDNETGSDLIATRLGSAVIVFQFIMSGQSLDYLGVDPIEAELETVRTVMRRVG